MRLDCPGGSDSYWGCRARWSREAAPACLDGFRETARGFTRSGGLGFWFAPKSLLVTVDPNRGRTGFPEARSGHKLPIPLSSAWGRSPKSPSLPVT